MKKSVVVGLMMLWACASFSQGIPFLKNYSEKDYHAHNRNFDVVTDDSGIVYFANFEGLLYYDKVEWRMIHTPGITRVTVVYHDHNDVVWAGGYNYFGRIEKTENGDFHLQQIGNPGVFHGEIGEIWESDGELVFMVNDGNLYKVLF